MRLKGGGGWMERVEGWRMIMREEKITFVSTKKKKPPRFSEKCLGGVSDCCAQ